MSSRRRYASSRDRYESMTLLDDERYRSHRTYLEPPSPSYYGRNFPKAREQEDYWNEQSCRDVWAPYKEWRHVSRPETYGMANSYEQPRWEDEISDPYVKRPQPYPPRVSAEYDSYVYPSESHGKLGREARVYKTTPLGGKITPEYHHRESILEGKNRARKARDMANLAAQSRTGFAHKYPQAYEGLEEIRGHKEQVGNMRKAAKNYRLDDADFDKMLDKWESNMRLRDL